MKIEELILIWHVNDERSIDDKRGRDKSYGQFLDVEAKAEAKNNYEKSTK